MRQPKTEKEIRCPLEYGLSVFGGKWKSRIICVLNEKGTLRYSACGEKCSISPMPYWLPPSRNSLPMSWWNDIPITRSRPGWNTASRKRERQLCPFSRASAGGRAPIPRTIRPGCSASARSATSSRTESLLNERKKTSPERNSLRRCFHKEVKVWGMLVYSSSNAPV